MVGGTGRVVAGISIVALFALCPPVLLSQGDAGDLTSVSLEDLMKMPVTAVSRHQQEIRRTASAVYVITQEDIRRSGATDVAELLRLAPGVEVSQINSSIWAVSVRGFNAQYANKLLVLVDGRSVYDPAFSGVYWNLQNLVLDDIERIEVIRGPGATMWGANAVNGVISITTKRAADTQGGLLVAEAGSNRPGEGSVRYGGAIGSKAFYRAFGTQTTRSALSTSSGTAGRDAWNLTNGGLRVDWNPSQRDFLKIEGASHRGVEGSADRLLDSLAPITYRDGLLFRETGGHVLARWTRSLKDKSDLSLQFYYDKGKHYGFQLRDVSVWDFDFQHNFKAGSRQSIVWGLAHREMRDQFQTSFGIGFNPDRKSTSLSSAFVQDEVAVVPDRLYVTGGGKVERNSYTGYEIHPAVHVLWLPTTHQSIWASAAHTDRTANRVDRGLRINAAPIPMGRSVGLLAILGQEKTRSEQLDAYETGYRYNIGRKLGLDVAGFYNVYDHLGTSEPGAAFNESEPQPAHLVIPIYFDNLMKGETYGVEATANYKVTHFLSLRGSYSLLRMRLHKYADSKDAGAETAEGESPANQFYAGSFLTLPKSFELSTHAYVVGKLPAFKIDRHARIDLNLTWKALENIELSVAGQNLLGSSVEFGKVGGTPADTVNRSIFGRITWKF